MLRNLADDTADAADKFIQLLDASSLQDEKGKRTTRGGQIAKSFINQPKVDALVEKLEIYGNELVQIGRAHV